MSTKPITREIKPRARARARAVLESVLGQCETRLTEAVVRLPPRSTKFVAVYTGANGVQVARSTGLRDRDAALVVARRWEAEARQVAVVLRISERAVRAIEKRAIAKLKRHPALRSIWQEFSESVAGAWPGSKSERTLFSTQEVEALLGLSRTPFEHQVLCRVLAVVGEDHTRG